MFSMRRDSRWPRPTDNIDPNSKISKEKLVGVNKLVLNIYIYLLISTTFYYGKKHCWSQKMSFQNKVPFSFPIQDLMPNITNTFRYTLLTINDVTHPRGVFTASVGVLLGVFHLERPLKFQQLLR